jgi:hypothetical protein
MKIKAAQIGEFLLETPPVYAKTTPKPDFSEIFCRAGVTHAIQHFTPAGGTFALHLKSPKESRLWY